MYREVIMRENSDEKNLKLVAGAKKETPEKPAFSSKVTSPIRKMLLNFNKEKAKDKFRITDLFK